MAIEISVALVGVLLKTVLPLVVSEFKAKLKKPLPCKGDVEKLGAELEIIIARIKDHEESYHGRKISHLQEVSVNQLRTLAYEIEDCAESFLRQVMSDDGLEKKDTSSKFGLQIRSLLASAERWNEKAVWTGGGESSSTAGARAPDSSADPIRGDLPAVGMEEPLKELKKLVVAQATVKSERKLKVISIVGFGGLGKTLLASQVYNYVDENSKFDLRVWVRADDRNAHQLLQEILQFAREQVRVKTPSASNSVAVPPTAENKRSIFNNWFSPVPQHQVKDNAKGKGKEKENGTVSHHSGQGHTQDTLVEQLKTLLENKRKEQWSGINGAFTRTSGIDSRIIVTTTKHPVAKCCSDGGGYVYKMSSLGGDDPGTLFLYPHGDKPLDDLSKDILRKCGGLPLALIGVSQNCKGEFENRKTRSKEALDNMCGPRAATASTYMNTPIERMGQMLLSSYQDLPNSLEKVCLLYMGMFPANDDDDVRRNSVIRRLQAEGLAAAGDGQLAVNDLETLIDHCVIQSTEVSNSGKTKRCRVPGIVLEYITRVAESQGFVTVCDESKKAQPKAGARRLCLHPNSDTVWTLPVESEPKVRTLVVLGNKNQGATTLLSNKEAISKCELLRVLDLEGCGGLDRSDLRNLCHKLLLLKYLSLGPSTTEVPRSIRKLQALQTLDMRKTNIDMVPLEVITLPHLKHLLGKFQLDDTDVFRKLDFFRKNMMVRKELAEFFSSGGSMLETLSGFVIGTSRGFPQLLIHMAKLRKVKIWCGSTSTAHAKNLVNLSQGIQKFLRLTRDQNGRSLSIDIRGCPFDSAVKFLGSLAETALTPHPPSLYSFKLHGQIHSESRTIKGVFPDFLTQLTSITELSLCFTNLSPAAMQQGLNLLKNAALKYLKLVENKLGTLKLFHEKFTSLERICLVAMEETAMITITDKPLPSLVSLHVLCEGLDGLSGINIGNFPNLKEVGLHYKLEDGKKGLWETGAKSHPNWPNLVLIDPPKPKGS